MTARYIIGDSLTVLRTLPDASVDVVITSPPFLALRSYLPSDHPDKAMEMGSEPTPGEFIDALLDIVEECRRVLAPHGSICFELGDTYAGNDTRVDSVAPDAKFPQRPGVRTAVAKSGGAWPLDKSLCLIPELFRIALVYGRNPLTGRETPRWRARNVIRWCRPNPPVGALGDKVRPATSDMVIACVGRKRYFDRDAVRTPYRGDHKMGEPVGGKGADYGDGVRSGWSNRSTVLREDRGGAPPLDHWWTDDDRFDQDAWNIPTVPYRGAHYATFPERLVVRPILAMCPARVCTTCGKPSERIIDAHRAGVADDSTRNKSHAAAHPTGGYKDVPEKGWEYERTTLGWSDCGHDAWRPGVVLDPFAGSGTTLAVAQGHGRDSIGIDLDERNADLARERIGMFLEVVTDQREPPARTVVEVVSPLLSDQDRR